MRLVTGFQPMHELYSPKSRKIYYPKADYRFLIHAALNVALGRAGQEGRRHRRAAERGQGVGEHRVQAGGSAH